MFSFRILNFEVSDLTDLKSHHGTCHLPLQNLPQVALQIWYMTDQEPNEVAIISTVFSVLSIIVTVQTVMTQRMIMKKQSFMVIEFDVKCQSIKRGMERNVRKIKRDIASVFGVHQRAVDIEQGLYLSAGGFHLRLYVDVNENEGTDYGLKMQKAIDSGSLPQSFQKHWKLGAVPIITDLKCRRLCNVAVPGTAGQTTNGLNALEMIASESRVVT